jgi:PAS domain S-box-containing protein
VFWYNSQWYQYTGTTADEVLGWGWKSLHDPDVLPAVLERWGHSLTSEEPFEMVYPLRGADGAMRPFLTRVAPVRDEAGRVVRWFGTNVDISAERAAEAELRAHREHLEHLVQDRTKDLSDALDHLHAEVLERERTEEALRQSQKMDAVGQLTGGIAHDFNNLLTGIAGCMEIMQTRLMQGRTDDLGRYISAASDSINRAASLTHRLLAFARRQTLERKPVDINRLAAGMEDLIRRTVGPSIVLELVFGGDVWTTLCDHNQLESALLNLCINAKDAMPDGGRLMIETANAHLDEAYAATQGELRPGE